jgi:hypothetical protein
MLVLRNARYKPVIKDKVVILAADAVRTIRWGGCDWTITRQGTTLTVETSRLTDVAVYGGPSGWTDRWQQARFFHSVTKDVCDGLKDGETYDLQFALSPDERAVQQRLWHDAGGCAVVGYSDDEDSDDD